MCAQFSGFLTSKDKEHLNGDSEYNSRQGRYQRRRSIRERTRLAFGDFSTLVDTLDTDEREKIFDTDKRSKERAQQEQELADMIQFIYTGLGGQRRFSSVLEQGVQNGEYDLGNVSFPLLADPSFTLGEVQDTNVRSATDLIEGGDYDRLSTPDLFQFVRFAQRHEAIDFDGIRSKITEVEETHQYQNQKGYARYTKRRPIPNGKFTPLMEPSVYEEQRIGEKDEHALKEMFGQGYNHREAFYDGEDVYSLPGFGLDEEPETLRRVPNRLRS
jgi:hypothetical protein